MYELLSGREDGSGLLRHAWHLRARAGLVQGGQGLDQPVPMAPLVIQVVLEYIRHVLTVAQLAAV